MTVTCTFNLDELELIRRGFLAGSPDAGTMALPDFPWDAAGLAATGARLAACRPSEPMQWPDDEWDCLAACCLVASDLLDGLSEENYDLLAGMLATEPDPAALGFY